MALPNEPVPPKKPGEAPKLPAKPAPTPPSPLKAGPPKPAPPSAAKPAPPPAGKPMPVKPTTPPKPAPPAPVGAKPPVKPTTPSAPTKPPVKPAGKPAVPASAVRAAPVAGKGVDKASGRRIGQIFIDLGYIDDGQLWELLEDAKQKSTKLGQAAIAKGLVTEQQLMQALAEQFSLKLLTTEELKPTNEALTLVPETMSSVYKVLPLTVNNGSLTVAMGDPANLSSMDDLRSFLSINEIVPMLAPQSAIDEILAKCYAGKEESIVDIIQSLNDDDALSGHRGREGSIDLDTMMSEADAAPVRKLVNMVMLLAIKDRARDRKSVV